MSSIVRSALRLATTGLRTPPVNLEEQAYRRIAAKGFQPASIIDIGAYEGNWTRLVRRVFPNVPVLMLEAQQGKRPFLEAVCRDLPDVRYESALVSSSAGQEVEFFEMETGSSLFPERSDAARRSVTMETVTLDSLTGNLPGPIFLKIDVQGAELEVLRGGQETLAKCELVQLELAIVPYNEGAPLMLDVLNYMDTAGFVPVDISGLTRPNRVDLAQIDMLFVPRSSTLRTLFFTFGQ